MSQAISEKNSEKNLIKDIRYFFFFWPWFLFSILFFLIVGFIYLRYTSPLYETQAQIQIKKTSSDPSNFLTQTTQTFFGFERVKIDNEIEIMKSSILLEKVIEKLDLQTMVFSLGRINNILIYNDSIPFDIQFRDKFDDEIIITLIKEGNKVIVNENLNGFEKIFDLNANFLKTENYSLTLNKNFYESKKNYLVQRNSRRVALKNLLKSIDITPSTEENNYGFGSDNIKIKYNGKNKERNEDIVNAILECFMDDQVNDKRQIFSLSLNFIDSRLNSIIGVIDSLNLETTEYKKQNLIFTPELQTDNALSDIVKSGDESLKLEIQLDIIKSLENSLKIQNNFSLLPFNIGIENSNLNDLILLYNEIVNQRTKLLAGATKQNPIIVQLNSQLEELKINLFKSLENYKTSINSSLIRIQNFKNESQLLIDNIPEKETKLRSFSRNFEIAEKLYLFLLEKKEEASISLISAVPNSKIIDYGFSTLNPVYPNKTLIYFLMLVLGILTPFSVFFLLKIFDTKIHTREQLNYLLKNPIVLGEIPFVSDTSEINKTRGVIAESIRVIRSNLNYMLNIGDNQNKDNLIMVSSSTKGEGKTFIAYNLASSLAASGKKVLLIGGDLRNPRIHNLLNFDKNINGLSTIISDNKIDNYKEFLVSKQVFKSKLEVLLSGPIPPNPSELLGGDKMKLFLERVKNDYEFVIIDSAPLMLVSDSTELIKKMDLLLYVVRSGFTDENVSDFINVFIKNENLKKTAFIFNGLKTGPASYYKYGYGYRYAYSYKYNYGYGYGYAQDKD